MEIVSAPRSLGQRTRRKIALRILPFLFLLYMVAYLDRANVAFAKLAMSGDLGFSDAVFGFGAGIFFLGYFLLEIPGALIVEHWSARRWIARILVTWGIFTVLVGFVRTAQQFYWARFLVGAAEAGFFPGIIIYLTHWFPKADRARAMAGFIMAAPLSLAIGAPLSALIMRLDWFGWPGWRWVFVLEGLPAIILGGVTLYYLTDHPRQAGWLTPEERQWIEAKLDEEAREKKRHGHFSLWSGLKQRNVYLLAFGCFFANIAGYGFIFWLPTSLQRSSGLSVTLSNLCATLPFALAVLSVFLNGRASDRSGERRLHACIPMLTSAVLLFVSALPGQPFWLVMFWLSLAGASVFAWNPVFWVLPTLTLGESAAAASIGFINSVGNLGGFVGPSILGLLLSRSHSFLSAVSVLCICYLVSATLTFLVTVPRAVPLTPQKAEATV